MVYSRFEPSVPNVLQYVRHLKTNGAFCGVQVCGSSSFCKDLIYKLNKDLTPERPLLSGHSHFWRTRFRKVTIREATKVRGGIGGSTGQGELFKVDPSSIPCSFQIPDFTVTFVFARSIIEIGWKVCQSSVPK